MAFIEITTYKPETPVTINVADISNFYAEHNGLAKIKLISGDSLLAYQRYEAVKSAIITSQNTMAIVEVEKVKNSIESELIKNM